jgi:hypothetical protein
MANMDSEDEVKLFSDFESVLIVKMIEPTLCNRKAFA